MANTRPIFCVIIENKRIVEIETVNHSWFRSADNRARRWFKKRGVHHTEVIKLKNGHWVYKR